jgi:hypothetical protein
MPTCGLLRLVIGDGLRSSVGVVHRLRRSVLESAIDIVLRGDSLLLLA